MFLVVTGDWQSISWVCAGVDGVGGGDKVTASEVTTRISVLLILYRLLTSDSHLWVT